MNQKIMHQLGKYSIGIGDRFAHQAEAQLKAVQQARAAGIELTPVWNKSYREHQIIGSDSETTRRAADAAVQTMGWNESYLLDADHINISNVDFFIDTCDFFTIDVADFIGQPADSAALGAFMEQYGKYIGPLDLPGQEGNTEITSAFLEQVGAKYLYAAREAGRVYRHIREQKGDAPLVIEVSMDETDAAQSPVELFLILGALADEAIPVQTIAPKFSGRFNKGVDYVGDLDQFRVEFEQAVTALKLAINEFGLPGDLKLSVHSGSDKFSLYPVIREIISRHDVGLHLKTAGTTWLEELIGLAEAGGDGLELAKDIYRQSLDHYDELCGPYAAVIDIDKSLLPEVAAVTSWDGPTYTATLRHDQSNPSYNLHFRQLLHVGYKIAAKMGVRYTGALVKYRAVIAENVTENLFDRHIKPLFLG
jgi:hypothetical protein